jgi:hypothetical protein
VDNRGRAGPDLLLERDTKLWKVWWLWGLPVAALTGALIWGGEWAYHAGYPALEALLGVARILLYLFWFRAVWRCSRNVAHSLWTHLARWALVLGLLATAVLY